ncbi:MAG: hypothetical protein K2L12_02530 [Clostridia bacterium]|nr:hypothetical protein [Clostridia bacterium]
MDIRKYDLDKEDLEFIIDLLISFSRGTEIEFECLGKEYFIETVDGGICARENTENAKEYIYSIPEFFFEQFMIDGKPFIERLNDITSYGIL